VKTSRAILLLLLLLSGAFTLGTLLQPRILGWSNRSQSDSALKRLLGESRRLFGDHFYVKADVYFHSGLYPSIFDQARQNEARENHMAAAQQGDQGKEGEHEHEEGMDFLGRPKDWVDSFGRRFLVTEHTHLEGGTTREMLPWLRISAELDPQRIETYTVASYFLRRELNRPDEAEEFLRQGLRANPGSYEILFELGRLYYENRHDAERARNLWLLALQRWEQTEGIQKEPYYRARGFITADLAHLEEEAGNFAEAIKWFEQTKMHSPNPDEVQKQIDVLKSKLAGASGQK
jgi:tetratricopeptide (TPR) repeat protein